VVVERVVERVVEVLVEEEVVVVVVVFSVQTPETPELEGDWECEWRSRYEWNRCCWL